MKILLLGKNGQVGFELERSLQSLGEVIAADRMTVDLTNPAQIRAAISQVNPHLIVNAAAYTDVDRAEQESAIAMQVNAQAPAIMAEEARKVGAALIHYSTDYVFDGTRSGPYVETDLPNPLNAYGRSKLAGEQAIQASDIPHLIIRTSWVYGSRGRNFMRTVLRLAQKQKHLRIVNDQFGAPTWCRTIAEATARAIDACSSQGNSLTWDESKSGLYHLTAQEQTTWYGFSKAIIDCCGLSDGLTIEPITSCEYPLPASRPKNSVLSCDRWIRNFGTLPTWETDLQRCCQDL